MTTSPFLSTTAVLVTTAALAISQASASIVAANFGTDWSTTPTDSFTSVQIPESINSDSWQNFAVDRTASGSTLPAGATSLNIYFDSARTWRNNDIASASSPFRGYLDDGVYNNINSTTGWALEISGLNAWLTANNSTEWKLVILRSTDNTTDGFRDISIHTGTTAELTSIGLNSSPSALWGTDPVVNSTIDNWPDGGTASTITNGTFVSTGTNSGYSETNAFTGNSDAFIIRDTGISNTSGLRGSIAGLVLYTAPEPSATVLATITLLGLVSRRRR